MTADERFERFAVDELHRIEIIAALLAEVEHAGNVGMAQARRRPRLAQNRCRAMSLSR